MRNGARVNLRRRSPSTRPCQRPGPILGQRHRPNRCQGPRLDSEIVTKPIQDAPGLNFTWERGYFSPSRDDRRASQEHGGQWRKNIDFLRLKDLAIHLVDPRPGLRILEVGCGEGAQLINCGLLGAEVHGVDIDECQVAVANAKFNHLDIEGEARIDDVGALSYPDDSFDVVLSSDCHEHLPTDLQFQSLQEALRVLKPGGRLVLKTPNRAYLKLSLQLKRIAALCRLENPCSYVIPRLDEQGPLAHVGLTTRWALSRQLRDAGYLNYEFHHPALRRLGSGWLTDVLSTEIPIMRDFISEDLIVRAYKPIALSFFPD